MVTNADYNVMLVRNERVDRGVVLRCWLGAAVNVNGIGHSADLAFLIITIGGDPDTLSCSLMYDFRLSKPGSFRDPEIDQCCLNKAFSASWAILVEVLPINRRIGSLVLRGTCLYNIVLGLTSRAS